jgi:hypothetical protein
LHGLVFDPEDGDQMFLRKVDKFLPDYTNTFHIIIFFAGAAVRT